MSLPIFYSFYYFVPHYIRRLRVHYNGGDGEATPNWNTCLKSSLFLTNLLYLPLTGQLMSLFNCKPLGDGTAYLVAVPTVTCYTGGHESAMFLSPAPLFTYTLGIPTTFLCMFYIGTKKNLMSDPTFGGTFGFVYKRYGMFTSPLPPQTGAQPCSVAQKWSGSGGIW